MVLVSRPGSGRERTKTVCGATTGPAFNLTMGEHDLVYRNGRFLDLDHDVCGGRREASWMILPPQLRRTRRLFLAFSRYASNQTKTKRYYTILYCAVSYCTMPSCMKLDDIVYTIYRIRYYSLYRTVL